MPVPTPLFGGVFMKATVFFTYGRWGWTESYYAQITGGTNPWGDMAAAVQQINVARKPALPTFVAMEAMRVEIVQGAAPGQSQLFSAPNYGLGFGSATGAYTDPWGAWLFRDYDVSGTIRSSRLVRGWVSADLDGYTAGGAALAIGLPARVSAYLKNLNVVLGGGFTGTFGGVGVWAIPGYNRSTTAPGPGQPFSPVLNITGTTLTPQNRLIFTTVPVDVNINTNSTILIKVKRIRCARGISGMATVLTAPINTGVQTITTTKLFCCVGADLTQITGTIRNKLQAFYQYRVFNPNGSAYQTVQAIRAVNKKTGRTFFGTVGHQKSKCC